MTVISASYKTDIPAFYGNWFSRRMAAGWVAVRNPFNGHLSKISLRPDAVSGFVFWTRNAGPFLPVLNALVAGRFPFYFQFTITGYPRLLEPSVLSRDQAIDQVLRLAERYGPAAVVWRYDPILLSDLTPEAFHQQTFADISAALAGAVDEVVVSFTRFYRKTSLNLRRVEAGAGLAFRDPDATEKQALLDRLSSVAAAHGQTLTLCTQPELAGPAAACISADRLAAMGGTGFSRKIQGNRDGCLCVQSRDIGAYDSCAQGCVYCYAVRRAEKGQAFVRHHDPAAAELL
ncbi:DUF1848 domain-containing protein [Sneathiella chinensis]|uniref:DNA repair photolyase n=1 Tax=Sneathiella chinensis TaxID=349750 RepID=A0ABQ5TZ34_9PROT|nr:DUF1848 domain-containing protein [Sneathiella chinensis]GLQ05267.1 hypothetical protein GCM10007924_04880 [Sneathiella chinensis]